MISGYDISMVALVKDPEARAPERNNAITVQLKFAEPQNIMDNMTGVADNKYSDYQMKIINELNASVDDCDRGFDAPTRQEPLHRRTAGTVENKNLEL